MLLCLHLMLNLLVTITFCSLKRKYVPRKYCFDPLEICVPNASEAQFSAWFYSWFYYQCRVPENDWFAYIMDTKAKLINSIFWTQHYYGEIDFWWVLFCCPLWQPSNWWRGVRFMTNDVQLFKSPMPLAYSDTVGKGKTDIMHPMWI